MALHKMPKGGQVIKTPPPDEDARVQNYGASSLMPGKGGPLTALGRNLRDSIPDEVHAKILAVGTSGRNDTIPADDVEFAKLTSLDANDLPAGGELQRRRVSDTSYPLAHGAVSQQDAQKVFGKVSDQPQRVAHKLSANGMRALARGTARAAQPVRKP